MEEQPQTVRVIVVGAGQAGMHFCFALRRLGFDGEIVLLGDEAQIGRAHV